MRYNRELLNLVIVKSIQFIVGNIILYLILLLITQKTELHFSLSAYAIGYILFLAFTIGVFFYKKNLEKNKHN